jgi:hypothetical protein
MGSLTISIARPSAVVARLSPPMNYPVEPQPDLARNSSAVSLPSNIASAS